MQQPNQRVNFVGLLPETVAILSRYPVLPVEVIELLTIPQLVLFRELNGLPIDPDQPNNRAVHAAIIHPFLLTNMMPPPPNPPVVIYRIADRPLIPTVREIIGILIRQGIACSIIGVLWVLFPALRPFVPLLLFITLCCPL